MTNVIFIFLFILLTSLSCSQKKEKLNSTNVAAVEESNFQQVNDFEKFWNGFQNMVVNKDTSVFNQLIAFPLEGSDFIVNRYDGKGLNQQELIENYEKLFPEFVVNRIVESTISDLVFDSNTNTYRLHISNRDDMGEVVESFMFYFRKEGKLSRIDYAG